MTFLFQPQYECPEMETHELTQAEVEALRSDDDIDTAFASLL